MQFGRDERRPPSPAHISLLYPHLCRVLRLDASQLLPASLTQRRPKRVLRLQAAADGCRQLRQVLRQLRLQLLPLLLLVLTLTATPA